MQSHCLLSLDGKMVGFRLTSSVLMVTISVLIRKPDCFREYSI